MRKIYLATVAATAAILIPKSAMSGQYDWSNGYQGLSLSDIMNYDGSEKSKGNTSKGLIDISTKADNINRIFEESTKPLSADDFANHCSKYLQRYSDYGNSYWYVKKSPLFPNESGVVWQYKLEVSFDGGPFIECNRYRKNSDVKKQGLWNASPIDYQKIKITRNKYNPLFKIYYTAVNGFDNPITCGGKSYLVGQPYTGDTSLGFLQDKYGGSRSIDTDIIGSSGGYGLSAIQDKNGRYYELSSSNFREDEPITRQREWCRKTGDNIYQNRSVKLVRYKFNIPPYDFNVITRWTEITYMGVQNMGKNAPKF